MKIICACGQLIHDGTDALPHKAHLIPDQAWHGLFDRLDEVIAHECQTIAQRESAKTLMRALIGGASRNAWQCGGCGRLYVHDGAGQLQCYVPADALTSRAALSGTVSWATSAGSAGYLHAP